KSLPARQEVRGAHSTACIAREMGREGRSPASVSGARRSLGCPIASRLPTEQTKSGNCREPYTAHPSRISRKDFRDSLKLDYPRLRGMLQITACWRYPYGAYRFPEDTLHRHSALPQRQCPSALYGPDSQRTGTRRPTTRGTGTRLEPGDHP